MNTAKALNITFPIKGLRLEVTMETCSTAPP